MLTLQRKAQGISDFKKNPVRLKTGFHKMQKKNYSITLKDP